MKTLINLFTDSTPNNHFTELTQGQLHIAIMVIAVLGVVMVSWIRKEMKAAK